MSGQVGRLHVDGDVRLLEVHEVITEVAFVALPARVQHRLVSYTRSNVRLVFRACRYGVSSFDKVAESLLAFEHIILFDLREGLLRIGHVSGSMFS